MYTNVRPAFAWRANVVHGVWAESIAVERPDRPRVHLSSSNDRSASPPSLAYRNTVLAARACHAVCRSCRRFLSSRPLDEASPPVGQALAPAARGGSSVTGMVHSRRSIQAVLMTPPLCVCTNIPCLYSSVPTTTRRRTPIRCRLACCFTSLSQAQPWPTPQDGSTPPDRMGRRKARQMAGTYGFHPSTHQSRCPTNAQRQTRAMIAPASSFFWPHMTRKLVKRCCAGLP